MQATAGTNPFSNAAYAIGEYDRLYAELVHAHRHAKGARPESEVVSDLIAFSDAAHLWYESTHDSYRICTAADATARFTTEQILSGGDAPTK